MEAEPRSKRRCASRRKINDKTPSAVHYVGYVEDDETPESIARKFEELERIQAAGRLSGTPPAEGPGAATPDSGAGSVLDAGAPSPDPASAPAEELTDEQLMEVFKQTSVFTVSRFCPCKLLSLLITLHLTSCVTLPNV